MTPTRKTFDVQLNVLGLAVGGVTGSVNDADGVMLRVAETTPAGVVSVDDATEIEIDHAGGTTADDGAVRA